MMNPLLQDQEFIKVRNAWSLVDKKIAALEAARRHAISELLLLETDIERSHGSDWLELIWDTDS